MSSLQLLQTFPILCSTWTTTSSTGKVWMRGSCTACDRLQSRLCSVQPWDFAVWGQPFPLALGCLSPCKPKGPLSCFCSTPSIHMSVHTETTEELSDRQLQQWPRWLYNPVRWELWQTDTDTQHPYELLVPLRHSQCSWSSDMTERGSLQASWQSIRPLITMVALLSACEVAVLVKKTACLLKQHWRGGSVVWIRRCPITARPVLAAKQEGSLCHWRPHHERTLHCFLLLFFFFAIYSCVPQKHIQVDR